MYWNYDSETKSKFIKKDPFCSFPYAVLLYVKAIVEKCIGITYYIILYTLYYIILKECNDSLSFIHSLRFLHVLRK